MKKDVYVVRKEGNWAVTRPNAERVSGIFPTQKDAKAFGRELAMSSRSELRIQGRDGKFRECNSYGNDPCPPKDKNR